MTQEEFRSLHSQLIEQYQWIEFNFKRILSLLMDKEMLAGLYELNGVAWGHLVAKIRTVEHEKDTSFIPDSVYDELDLMRERRNYWCHQCYMDISYIEGKDKVLKIKSKAFVDHLNNDFRDATDLQEQIQDIYYAVARDYLERRQPKFC